MRRESGFKHLFSTQETWQLIRKTKEKCIWSRGIWFSQATPKFSFMVWLVTLDILSTMYRISCWNPDIYAICVLCKNAPELRDLLFFECSYSSQIWDHLTQGILRGMYTNTWSEIMLLISDRYMEKKKLFVLDMHFNLQCMSYGEKEIR